MNSSSASKRLFVAMVVAIGGCTNSNDSLSSSGKQSANNQKVQLDPSKQVIGSAGEAVKFTVPASGGEVTVVSKSGVKVAFDVPAASAGKVITFTPTTASEIGWNDPNFAEVIRMEPDGSKFAEPIVVRPSNKALIVMDFPSSPTKSAPEGLSLNATKDGFLLYHFSTLVVFDPEYNCESQLGWVPAEADEQAANCADPAFPVMLKLNCLTHPYCLQIDAQCCAAEGATVCDLESDTLSLSYSRADETGEEYAYCIAQEEQTNSTSVCTQYEVSDCNCVNGAAGKHECLKEETGWTECVCESSSTEEETSEAGAICPEWHEGDCTINDAANCECFTEDASHSYSVSCDETANCECKVDDVVIKTFAWEAAACEGPEFIRERWFTHCSQGACP